MVINLPNLSSSVSSLSFSRSTSASARSRFWASSFTLGTNVSYYVNYIIQNANLVSKLD
jgi:hypothetical protein